MCVCVLGCIAINIKNVCDHALCVCVICVCEYECGYYVCICCA